MSRLDVMYVSWIEKTTRAKNFYKLGQDLGYKCEWFYFKNDFGGRIFFKLLSFFRLFCILILKRPKIIHVFNGPDVVIYPCIFGKFFGSKIIWDMRATPINDFKSKYPNNPFIFFLKFTKWFANKLSDKIVTPINYYSKKYGYTLLPQYILYTNKINRKKSNLGMKFLFLGYLSKHEGILQLLKEFSNVNNDKLSLIIVGGGPLRYKVEEYIKTDNRIKYLGWISDRSKINDIILESDVCIYCPRNEYPATIASHTSVLKLGEYFSFNKPIICPNIENLKYLKKYGVSLYDFNIEGSLGKLINSSDFCFTRCPNDIKKENVKNKYNDILEELL